MVTFREWLPSPSRACRRCRDHLFGLAHRLRHETNPEYRLFGLVQQLHLPVGILLEAAGNAADQIGANRRRLGPGRLAVLAFIWLVGRARISAVADPKEVERH